MDISEKEEKHNMIFAEFVEIIKQTQNHYDSLINDGVPNLHLLEEKEVIQEDLYSDKDDENTLLNDLYCIYNQLDETIIEECTDSFEEYRYFILYNKKFYEYHIMYGQGSISWVKKYKGIRPKKYIMLKEK